jgi:hypothetical protein
LSNDGQHPTSDQVEWFEFRSAHRREQSPAWGERWSRLFGDVRAPDASLLYVDRHSDLNTPQTTTDGPLDFTDSPLAEDTGGRNTGPTLASIAEPAR